VVLWGIPIYVSIKKSKGAKEPIIVASNIAFKNALEIYKKRWGIESAPQAHKEVQYELKLCG